MAWSSYLHANLAQKRLVRAEYYYDLTRIKTPTHTLKLQDNFISLLI